MNAFNHERARDLILMQGVEEMAGGDAAWLDAHLAECAECADFAETLQFASRAMRSTPVLAGSPLVSATQALVRARATELQDQQNRLYLIAISFALGLLWSAGTMFLGWRLSGWLAERFQVAAWTVGAAIVLFWLLPAAIMAVVLLFHHRPMLGPESALWMGVRREGDWQ